jgi:sterol desaturase/sphingolipid hydroxylase (fatty acid hydroxylase superfamily)
LARIVITPRLHGIHHSIVPEEVNSNWSSGLTVWDWLHGTLRTDAPQERIVIGVAGFLGDSEQQLGNVLSAPFRDGAAVPEATARGIRQPISQLE